MKVSDIQPLDDYVLLAPIAAEETSQGGIVLPKRMQKAKHHTVLAVGNGRTIEGGVNNGVRVPLAISPGDTVLLGTPLEMAAGDNGTFKTEDQGNVYLVRFSAVLALVEEVAA